MENDLYTCDLTKAHTGSRIAANAEIIGFSICVAAIYILLAFHGLPKMELRSLPLFAAYIFVTIYYVYYIVVVIQNLPYRIERIVLNGNGELKVTSADMTRTMRLDNVLFTITFTSFSTLAIVYISENDYVIARIGGTDVFFRDQKDNFKAFYNIAKYVKENSPHNENIIISRRSKRHPWIKIPRFLFRTELYSGRAEKEIGKIRSLYLKKLK